MRQTDINLLSHLLMRSLLDSCICPGWGSNPQPGCMGMMLHLAQFAGQGLSSVFCIPLSSSGLCSGLAPAQCCQRCHPLLGLFFSGPSVCLRFRFPDSLSICLYCLPFFFSSFFQSPGLALPVTSLEFHIVHKNL